MDHTQRFTSRVEEYNLYRPDYPAALLATLPVHPNSVVADLGSGTGRLSRLFLGFGCTVYGIEPNRPMAAAARAFLAGYANFHDCPGRAEATGLASESVDLVVAGQAFHWFEPEATAQEVRRIMRPGEGYRVALVWNDRNRDTPFECAYGQLVDDYQTAEYKALRLDKSEDEPVRAFLGEEMRKIELPNLQHLDLASLRGRTLSSSQMPLATDPAGPELLARLDELFERFQEGGEVRLGYTCKVYLGPRPD